MQLPRLYVSGPMSGLENFNFPAFHEVTRKLRAAGYEVSNPAEVALPCGCQAGTFCGADREHDWSDYLRADLVAMLQQADAIATLPGIEKSRGAQLEIHIAQALRWEVQPVGFWLGEVALPSLEPGALLRARSEATSPPSSGVA